MRVVGWFEIAVGVAMAGLWTLLLVTGQVPEIDQGRLDIWFHIGAELLTAALLIVAGLLLLIAVGTASTRLAALAAGALLYTTINSAGYYAEMGELPMVAMFLVLALATVGIASVLLQAPKQHE